MALATDLSPMQQAIVCHHAWPRVETLTAVHLLSDHDNDSLPTSIEQADEQLATLADALVLAVVDAEECRYGLAADGHLLRTQLLAERPSTRTLALDTSDQRSAYASHLTTLGDYDLVALIESEISHAAIMGAMRLPFSDGRHDRACSLLYAECDRRGKAALYDRGWQRAARQ